ncbi:MAG: hypothetical protein ACI4NG_03870 [Candidatus Gallimonas sp.]
MTLEALQHYLDVEKWNESAARGEDMCGKYLRCRYCYRYEANPCANAHNRLAEMNETATPDPAPAGLLPEPPLPAEEAQAAETREERRQVVRLAASRTENAGERVRLFVFR